MGCNPMDLSGKTILVTGASSGIGQAGARLFSQLGARVAVTGRNEARLQATLASLAGEGHRSYVFDLDQTGEVVGLVKQVAEDMGPLWGLFHCAGLAPIVPLQVLKEKDLDLIFASSFRAAMMLAKGFARRGAHGDEGGSMVFMSSVAATRGTPGLSVYAAAKAAVEGMVHSLATELVGKGLRVNALAAGGVHTGIHEAFAGVLSAEQMAAYEQRHLLGFGQPEDVAQAAAFLLSDAARWITGTTLVVDGGYTTQ